MKSSESKEEISRKNKNKKNGNQLRWTGVMDRCLIDDLVEQAALGNKIDKAFKTKAFTTVCNDLSSRFNKDVRHDHIKNRMKTIKKQYLIIKKLLTVSGFGFDATTKTIIVDDNVWDDYIKVHPDASDFRYRTIENWVEMGIVVGDDQATGSMTKAGLDFSDEVDYADAVEQFPRMNEEFGIDDIAEGTEASTEQSKSHQATSSTSRRHRKKSRMSNELVQMVDLVATNMGKIAEAMHAGVEAAYATDLYAEVMKIEGFEFDFLDDAFGILNGDDKLSRAFLARNERGRRHMLEGMINKDGANKSS